MANREEVRVKMAEFLRHPVSKLPDEALLADLVTDSMILVNMVIDLQEDFRIRLMQEDLKEVKTVGQVLAVFDRKMSGGGPSHG